MSSADKQNNFYDTNQNSTIKPNHYNVTVEKNLDNSAFYAQVMLWTMLSFMSFTASMIILGPLVPYSFMTPLYFIALGALIITSFIKKMTPLLSNTLTLGIPAVLGVVIYPTINYYVSSGQSDIVVSAGVGAVTIFGIMGAWGWVSKKDLTGWLPKMFGILIGVIVVSLLNAFVFQLEGLAFLISIAVVGLFAIYTFIDLQLIKKRAMGDTPASWYSLNLFLDLYNLFVALLSILGRR